MEKQAIITGGAIRVGKAISLALASAEYDIILLYNGSKKAAEETYGEIVAMGGKCFLYQCDISRHKNIKQFFDDISAEYKNIELLVNNSSIFEKNTFQESSEETFDNHFDINLKAPFFLSQFYSAYCKNNNIAQGHIINILDSYIKSNSGSYFAYLLSKKALAQFTEMSALALAPQIRVNAVSIGLLLASKFWSEDMVQQKTIETP
ncbi:MAG TPA: hypothetical protein DIV86_04330, partial [Alphaproteobacteria bacterium]|nr:hypothetical protein [Alphaproteobacteria bacterium]